MKNLIIRNAGIKDVKDLAIIHVKTWQHAYKGHIPQDYLNSLNIDDRTEKWIKNLKKPLLGTITLVAELNNKIVAFCTIGSSRDNDASKNTGEILSMYVKHSLLGKGIGSRLMEEAITQLKEKKYKSVTLWVLESNINARKFYESKGLFADGKTKIDKRENFELKEVRYRIDFN